MSPNPVCWFDIYVEDMDRAKTFYEQVLQGTLSKIESPGIEMWGFPMQEDQPGCSGALVKMDGVPVGQNSTIIYFSSADCAVEESRVLAAGGKIQQSKMDIGEYGFISLVVDTEGNIVGFHSMK